MNWIKIFGINGIFAPLVAFTFILLAIAYSPEFSWTENALSDLGVQKGVTAMLFNNGLIFSGVLAILFAAGLFAFLHEDFLGEMGGFFFILDSVALTAIGVFPENVKPVHIYASVVFFTLFPVSMFILTAAFLRTSSNKLGFFTFLVATVATIVWIIPFGKGVAIPETISALSASAWCIVLGCKLLKEK